MEDNKDAERSHKTPCGYFCIISELTAKVLKNTKQYFRLLSLLLVLTMTSACSKDDGPVAETPQPQIIFLFSPGGLGDMSYNDCILEGVQRFKLEQPETDIYIYSPESLDEAEKIFSDWLVRPESNIPVLFVLATSDYEPIAEKYLKEHCLTANKSILLFESRKRFEDPNIHTFQISMYGASYLAGATAARCCGDKKALALLANDSDSPIGIARDGFIAGFQGKCDVEYLADDWTGYIQSSLTYQKMSDWSKKYGYIFPVAGGSNAGIYRYSRENEDSPFLAGMDIDQSGLSNKITGSVIKKIDRLIFEYLMEWSTTGTMPDAQLYGLESGYADWKLSPLYKSEYKDVMEQTRQQAITKEIEYYEGD